MVTKRGTKRGGGEKSWERIEAVLNPAFQDASRTSSACQPSFLVRDIKPRVLHGGLPFRLQILISRADNTLVVHYCERYWYITMLSRAVNLKHWPLRGAPCISRVIIFIFGLMALQGATVMRIKIEGRLERFDKDRSSNSRIRE